MELKRKTSLQLQTLHKFYLENDNPIRADMESYAVTLGLTYKQVRSWFAEKRRQEKPDVGARREEVTRSSNSKRKNGSVVSNKKKRKYVQDLFPAEYIFKKVFRKDGPTLGKEFDSLPSSAAFRWKGLECGANPSCKENQQPLKSRKVSSTVCNDKDASTTKHGMGKGLMTVWRATNPHAGVYPTGTDNVNKGASGSSVAVRKPVKRNVISGRLRNKLQEKKMKKKHPVRSRAVEFFKDVHEQLPYKEKCDLALEGQDSEESFHQISMLMDDEELEARELQAVTNPPGCTSHFTGGARLDCLLCKDKMAKFPPKSVMMKQPLSIQPWESSPECVKKLFKVFHFLYTYSLETDVCPFTLDEFTQAFHDKDSLLLGRINLALLKLLLSDIEVELNDESSPKLSRSCNYLALLNSVENRELSLECWRISLNPLTWTEILRQVMVAAGFGSKQSTVRRENLDKEMHLMIKYGLNPGTLKGELFKILLQEGNLGLKVSDLAASLPVVDLKLASTTEEVECLICAMLSRDITLFEKISSSTYRLRINTIMKNAEECQSDSEDCGVVDDDDLNKSETHSSDEDAGDNDSRDSVVRKASLRASKNNALIVSTEIDESHPGEAWLLGLMEGEYSDLSIEEKLDALLALTDLLREGRTFRIEDSSAFSVDCVSSISRPISGGKIKRSSSAKHQNFQVPCLRQFGQIQTVKEAYNHWKYHAIDSSISISKEANTFMGAHPMQSVFLGSDRRCNRYWLFLGPCNGSDAGHGRVYFESSDDGHWEIIDTEECLRVLLSILDDRGKREAILIESLDKRQASLCEAMSHPTMNCSGTRPPLMQSDQFFPNVLRENSCSPVSDVENGLALSNVVGDDAMPLSGAIVLEVGNKGEEKKKKWWRLQTFDKWIWNSFYLGLNSVKNVKRSYFDSLTRCECCHDLYWRDEKHCRVCHTTFEIDFDQEERYAVHAATCRDNEATEMFRKVLPSQIQALKAATYAIESAMPKDALVGAWTKSAHKLWVKRLRRTSSLQELFQALGDFIGAINEDWLCQSNIESGQYDGEELVASFSSLPRTTAALALWLVDLDALISPYLTQGNTAISCHQT